MYFSKFVAQAFDGSISQGQSIIAWSLNQPHPFDPTKQMHGLHFGNYIFHKCTPENVDYSFYDILSHFTWQTQVLI